MTDQLHLFDAARAKRDAGISAAVNHADAVNPNWSDVAYSFLMRFATAHDCFTSEDVRRAAYAHHAVPHPPDERAWGAVLVRAVRAGVLVRDRYVNATDPKVHCSIVTRWHTTKEGACRRG